MLDNQKDEVAADSIRKGLKKSYQAPVLTIYGDIRALTHDHLNLQMNDGTSSGMMSNRTS